MCRGLCPPKKSVILYRYCSNSTLHKGTSRWGCLLLINEQSSKRHKRAGWSWLWVIEDRQFKKHYIVNGCGVQTILHMLIHKHK